MKETLIKLSDKKNENQENKQLKFRYQKANNYNVDFSSGVIGGIINSCNIFIDFFNDFPKLPKSEICTFSGGNIIKREILNDESVDGVSRIISHGIIMSIDTAIQTHEWLGDMIKQSQSIKN